MSKFQIHKATRRHAKLRMALIGPAGAGKTYSALAVGTTLVPGGRVVLIDTECGSAELYGNKFDFDTLPLTSHSPLNYVEAIQYCEDEKYDVIIADSLSHAWMGKDGALEQVDKAADRGGGNSWTAWRSVTPKHNALVEKMLNCKAHFITTIRAKTAYVQEKNEKTGKTEIKKLGLEAIQRDGLEYEFTLVGDIDLSNTLKVSKTRLDGVVMPGDIFEKPGANLAKKIYGWLMDGAAVTPIVSVVPPPVDRPAVEPTAASSETTIEPAVEDVRSQIEQSIDDVFAGYLKKLGDATTIVQLDEAAVGPGKPSKKPEDAERRRLAMEIYKATKDVILSKQAVAS